MQLFANLFANELVSSIRSTDDIVELYEKGFGTQNAMLAISAGGTTMTELGCMGVPIVSFSFVDNQDRIVKTFAEDGYAHYGGFWMIEGEELIKNICKAAKQLVVDKKLREEYSCKSTRKSRSSSRIYHGERSSDCNGTSHGRCGQFWSGSWYLSYCKCLGT